MTSAVSSRQSRRKVLAEARQEYDRLVTAVEAVLVGRAPDGIDFLCEFKKAADRLLSGLQLLGIPLDDRLEYFRDFVVGQHPSASPFTALGLPLDHGDGGPPCLVVELARAWLCQMRDLGDALRYGKSAPSGNERKGKGGRPQSDAVIKLHQQVATLLGSEIERLVKNGMPSTDACQRVKDLSSTDILRRLSDSRGNPYPLHGAAGDKLRKQVTRSPAYRSLREATTLETCDDATEAPLAKDEHLALEIGLRPRRARHN
jgi:hypothetical protein